jgi:hypothetical protein
MMATLGQSASLLVLFVALPIAVGVAVMSVMARRGPVAAPGTRTSELLATGEPADADVLELRKLGSIFDQRPMVRLRLEVHPAAGDTFELTVVQSLPRRVVGTLTPGTRVQARLGPDHTTGAIVVAAGP